MPSLALAVCQGAPCSKGHGSFLEMLGGGMWLGHLGGRGSLTLRKPLGVRLRSLKCAVFRSGACGFR